VCYVAPSDNQLTHLTTKVNLTKSLGIVCSTVLHFFPKTKENLTKASSHGLAVKVMDSWSRGCEFESCHILDGCKQ
jgi:hypothetical protein